MAKSTTAKPIVFSNTTVFAREASSVANLTSNGDFFIDYDVGLVIVRDSVGAGAAMPNGGVVGTMSYFHYDAAAAVVGSYAAATGDLEPGDYVTCDLNSNYVPARKFLATDVEFAGLGGGVAADADLAAMASAVAAREDTIIGQVLDDEIFPKDYLERVRTAYKTLGTMDQLPGSATGGLPAMVTYAGAANKVIHIRLLK
jgi:hypothetical protein